jgi:hypothetical protein
LGNGEYYESVNIQTIVKDGNLKTTKWLLQGHRDPLQVLKCTLTSSEARNLTNIDASFNIFLQAKWA